MKLGAIIICRMDSSRLPGKVLAEVGGEPLLWYVVARIRQIEKLGDNTIVATSSSPIDDPIADFCQKHSVRLFRGSHDNVPARLLACAQENRLDWMMRVNADSPYIHRPLIENACDIAESSAYEMVTNLYPRSFPYGVSVELIKTKLFSDSYGKMTSPVHREHPTSYFYENMERFTYYNIRKSGDNLSHIRLTIDTEEDLKSFRAVVDAVGKDMETLSYGDVLEIYRHSDPK